MMNMADEFILFDDVQYTRRDWRNRNKIKSPAGLHWLTIPVDVKSNFHIEIRDVKIADTKWKKKHWHAILHSYAKAKHFAEYKDAFEELYSGCTERHLSEINLRFLNYIKSVLSIDTPLKWSWEYKINSKDKNMKLIEMCIAAKAGIYISGPSAKGYIDERLFEEHHIKILWMNYENYPEYTQLFSPFEHQVSAVDLILNEGVNAKTFLKSFDK